MAAAAAAAAAWVAAVAAPLRLSDWEELFESEKRGLIMLNELMSIITKNMWKITTVEYLSIVWARVVDGGDPDIDDDLDTTHAINFSSDGGRQMDLPRAQRIEHFRNSVLMQSVLQRSTLQNVSPFIANESSSDPFDRIAAIFRVRPVISPATINHIRDCIDRRGGKGIQTGSATNATKPSQPKQPVVLLSDHMILKKKIDPDDWRLCSKPDIGEPTITRSLHDLGRGLHTYGFNEETIQTLLTIRARNARMDVTGQPLRTMTLEQLLLEGSYATAEKISPAAFRAASHSSAFSRSADNHKVSLVLVTPTDALKLGRYFALESIRCGYADPAAFLADKVLKAESFAKKKKPPKIDQLHLSPGCICVGLAFTEETVGNFGLEMAIGGGDPVLSIDTVLDLLGDMAKKGPFYKHRFTALANAILHGTFLSFSLTDITYKILSSDNSSTQPITFLNMPLANSSIVSGFGTTSRMGSGGGWPSEAFFNLEDSSRKPDGWTLSGEVAGTGEMEQDQAPAVDDDGEEEVDEERWTNLTQRAIREPGSAEEEAQVHAALAAQVPARYFNPMYLSVGPGYIVFRIAGKPWYFCLLRLMACLYCSGFLASPQISNQEIDEETGAARSQHAHAGVAFTRHLLPMMRSQAGALLQLLENAARND